MKKLLFLPLLLMTGCARGQGSAPATKPNSNSPLRKIDAPLLDDGQQTPGAQPKVMPVGAGSYASFPPPEEKTSRDTVNRELYLTPDAAKRPIPTNKWWTNLMVDKYAGQIWAFPHQVKADQNGLQLTFPTRWNDSGSDPISENPLLIGSQDFQPVDARAKNWSDWLVTFRLAQSDTKFFDVTLGRGLPYVWIEPTGVTPQLAIKDATFFNDAGADAPLPTTSDGFGLEFGGRSYGIFAPTGTRFSRDGDLLSMQFSGAKKFLVICPLSAKTDLALFRRYAYAIPRDSRLSWDYDPQSGTVTTKWHLETETLQGTEKRLLQGWLPHHYRDTVNDLKWAGPQYLSPRGTLKLAAGTDFTITYPFRGLPFALPAPQKTGLPNDFDPARMNTYLSGYTTQHTDYGKDTYWGGKSLLQWGQYLWMAREAGDTGDAAKIHDLLYHAMADWMTYTPGEEARYFARYPKWKALVGFNSSYGSESFNDQHFHYGYFTAAGAMLGFDDPKFLKDYGPMLRLVAKEYANWDRDDPNFPFLRTFDAWEGHSWAGGFSSPTGDNQESSSEAMQSWAGLFWLGQAMGDEKITACGAMGYAMESRAVQEYWFNQRGGNWSPNWKHPVVGMVWSGGNNYGTYFSGDPVWIWAIQWLPVTPAVAYLVEDPAFAKKSFADMWAASEAKNGPMDLNKLGTGLGNVVISQAAQVNPDWAAQQMDNLWAANSPVAKDNDTPGITYYLIHTNRTLGQIQWDTHLSLPLSRAYYNPRTKQTTYMAFNSTDRPQTAVVYKGAQKVTQFTVPPHQLQISH